MQGIGDTYRDARRYPEARTAYRRMLDFFSRC
jgi:hypothetical protein